MPNSNQADDIFPVVVIGAGLAGLTAAVHLAARDVPPLVLEADLEWPGGRLSGGAPDCFEYAGRTWAFNSEHGAHALWGSYDNMRATLGRFLDIQLRESIGEEWINRWRTEVRVVEAGTAVRGTWIPAPFHYLQLLLNPRFWETVTPLDILSLPGLIVSLMLAVGMDPIREEIALEGLMMKEFFRGWTPNLRATFTGLGRNLLAAPSEAITLTSFIAAMRFYTIMRRDAWHLDYLPANAHTCLIQPLINRIEGFGGMVMGGTTAQSLQRDGSYWKIRVEDARRSGTRSLVAERVILALDPLAAQRLLTASPDTAAAAAQIRFPPVLRSATARIWFDDAPRPGAPGGMFTGDFAIDNFFWLHRLHDEFFEWHTVTQGSAIEVHFYATNKLLDQTDEMLIVLATSEVLRAFPELKGHFVHAALRRNSLSQTQFLVPTAQSLHVQTPWPGILACGDWIGHPSTSFWMERCCVTGIAAANEVLQALDREPFALIPPRQPERLARLLGLGVHGLRRLFGPLIRGGVRLLRRTVQAPGASG